MDGCHNHTLSGARKTSANPDKYRASCPPSCTKAVVGFVTNVTLDQQGYEEDAEDEEDDADDEEEDAEEDDK